MARPAKPPARPAPRRRAASGRGAAAIIIKPTAPRGTVAPAPSVVRDVVVTRPAGPGGREDRELGALTLEIQELLRQSGQSDAGARVEVGRLLNEVRTRLPYGGWLAWLEREVPFTPRSAQSYIELWQWSRDHPVFYQTLSLLGPSKLYLLSKLDSALVARLSPRSVYVVPSTGHSRSVEQMSFPDFLAVVRQLTSDRALPEPSDELVGGYRNGVRKLLRFIDDIIALHRRAPLGDSAREALEELHDDLLDGAARLAESLSFVDE